MVGMRSGSLYTGKISEVPHAFKDSVVQAAFSSKDGAFLAAADMSGVIKVWKVAAKEVVWEFETSDITVILILNLAGK